MLNLPKNENVKRKRLLTESALVRVALKKDEGLMAYFAKTRLKHKSCKNVSGKIFPRQVIGGPGRIRTCDQEIMSPLR